MSKKIKNIFFLILKVSVTIFIISCLVKKIGWQNILDSFRNFSITYIVLTCLLLLLSYVPLAYSYLPLLASNGISVPYRRIFQDVFLVDVFRSFTPGS
ncbi:MAG TPA: hypothetical protein VJC03_03100, partial [bacterium]|nr:hypothetical protein [bacterium]